MGVHGMLVFGEKHVFMSHIPMFRAPHDAQLVLEVELPDRPATLSDRLYTFEPERFSLDALVAGTMRELTGTLYAGSFEDGGTPLRTGVRARVLRTLVARLPLGADGPPAAPTYWLVGERDDAYLVHVVGTAPSFDQVVRVRVNAGEVPAATATEKDRRITLAARTDDAAGRARPGPSLRAVGPAGALEMEPRAELSCLVGPDFDKRCE
jgi:hypothetical protein